MIRASGLSAKKSLGQNFLLDFNLTRRIARAAGPLEGATIVEIGPGPGGLTRALLIEGASRIVAVEKDERCLTALRDIAALYPGRLDVIAADAREVDCAALRLPSPARIVANLPYSVGTPLLIGWLRSDPWPPWFDRLVLMFQREVADRIVAKRRTKDYGRLAVLCVAHAPAHPLHHSGRGVHPAPQGHSALVELVPRETPKALATFGALSASRRRPSARGARCCAPRSVSSRPTARRCSPASASNLRHEPRSSA